MSKKQLSSNKNSHNTLAHCSICPIANYCSIGNYSKHYSDDNITHVLEKNKSINKGEIIFKTDMDFKNLYIIKSGSVKIYFITEQGDEQITSFHGPRDIIGLDAIAYNTHKSFAQALENTSICELHYTEIERLNSTLQFKFLDYISRLVSQKLLIQRTHIILLTNFSAEQKLAYFILGLHAMINFTNPHNKELVIPMTRYEIGNYIGLTIETISRTFTIFQKKKLLEVKGRRIKILEEDALKNLTSQLPQSSSF